jgi:hypothetical protein
LGVNLNKDDADAVVARKIIDDQKSGIIEACSAKAKALLDIVGLKEAGADADADAAGAKFDAAEKELALWDDLGSDKHWKLKVSKHKRSNQFGLALKRITALLKGSADNKDNASVSRSELFDARDAIVDSLGWTHISDDTKKWTLLAKANQYAPF